MNSAPQALNNFFCKVKILTIIASPSTDYGEGNGTHSSTLAWRIPWTEEPGRL